MLRTLISAVRLDYVNGRRYGSMPVVEVNEGLIVKPEVRVALLVDHNQKTTIAAMKTAGLKPVASCYDR